MKPELRAYLSTWSLGTWRGYLSAAYEGAEIGLERTLTADERKQLRRHVFSQIKHGVPGSSNVTGMVWAMLKGVYGDSVS